MVHFNSIHVFSTVSHSFFTEIKTLRSSAISRLSKENKLGYLIFGCFVCLFVLFWANVYANVSVAVEENGGSTERTRKELTWFTVTNAPSDTKARRGKLEEVTVDEFPLPVLIGIPIAVLILLIGTIVWCYFMTRKHYCTPHQFKQSPSQKEPDTDLSLQYYPRTRNETRNVSFNVYFDCPSDTRGQSEQSSPPTAHDKLDCPLETDPPLDGLVVHQELPWIRSNRTNHRKRVEREGFEFSESSGSETKCLKV